MKTRSVVVHEDADRQTNAAQDITSGVTRGGAGEDGTALVTPSRGVYILMKVKFIGG